MTTPTTPDLAAEVIAAREREERIRNLHRPVEVEPSDTICHECSNLLPGVGRYMPTVEYPCPTIRALDGPR